MIAAPPAPSSPSRRFAVKLGNLPAGAAEAEAEGRGEKEERKGRKTI